MSNICRFRVELRKGGSQEDFMRFYIKQYNQSKLKAEITAKSPLSNECRYVKPSEKKRLKHKKRVYEQALEKRELLGLNRPKKRKKYVEKNQKY